MEILKPGIIPEERQIVFDCDHCGCEFRVTVKECERTQSGYNETALKHDCPCCDRSLYFYGDPK